MEASAPQAVGTPPVGQGAAWSARGSVPLWSVTLSKPLGARVKQNSTCDNSVRRMRTLARGQLADCVGGSVAAARLGPGRPADNSA